MDEILVMLNWISPKQELRILIYKPDHKANQFGVTEGLQITFIKEGSDIYLNENFKVNNIIVEINLLTLSKIAVTTTSYITARIMEINTLQLKHSGYFNLETLAKNFSRYQYSTNNQHHHQ